VSCVSTLTIDASTDAFASNDLTLVNSCQAAPSGGFDSCRFTVGDSVNGSWTLIAPKPQTALQVTGGTIDLYYRDLHKSYPVTDWATSILFSDFFGISKWTNAYDEGVVEALLTLNWIDNEKVNRITKYRGVALLLVTAAGYDRMPIDSGNQAWGTSCDVQYSTAGRSAVKCQ
jgi:hypothetical protein